MQTLTQPTYPLGGYGDPHNVTLRLAPLYNVTLACRVSLLYYTLVKLAR